MRSPTPTDHLGPPPPERVIVPRRGLPGSRAVVGGLLVTVAAVGTWWAASGADGGTGDPYVVAARPIGPGQALTAEDLRLTTADLPDALRASAFASPDDLAGAVAVGPIDEGELVQAGAVAAATGAGAERELSFAVEANWAVAGSLRPGDRIDVLATYGDGSSSETVTVLRGAVVRRVGDAGGDGLGAGNEQTLTISIDDPDAVAATVNAARAGTVTVLRATGASGEVRPGTYRPGGRGAGSAAAGRDEEGEG